MDLESLSPAELPSSPNRSDRLLANSAYTSPSSLSSSFSSKRFRSSSSPSSSLRETDLVSHSMCALDGSSPQALARILTQRSTLPSLSRAQHLFAVPAAMERVTNPLPSSSFSSSSAEPRFGENLGPPLALGEGTVGVEVLDLLLLRGPDLVTPPISSSKSLASSLCFSWRFPRGEESADPSDPPSSSAVAGSAVAAFFTTSGAMARVDALVERRTSLTISSVSCPKCVSCRCSALRPKGLPPFTAPPPPAGAAFWFICFRRENGKRKISWKC